MVADRASGRSREITDLNTDHGIQVPSRAEVFAGRRESPVALAKLIGIFLFPHENESVVESECWKVLCKIVV